MTRCNIRNGTQNEIKRHCGPQRARSNPRYGNLKGKNANSPPHRHLLNPIIEGSQQPAWLPLWEGGLWASRAIPVVQVATHLFLCATGPVEPPWPWPCGRDPVGTVLVGVPIALRNSSLTSCTHPTHHPCALLTHHPPSALTQPNTYVLHPTHRPPLDPPNP